MVIGLAPAPADPASSISPRRSGLKTTAAKIEVGFGEGIMPSPRKSQHIKIP
jgi:hypothetical protein